MVWTIPNTFLQAVPDSGKRNNMHTSDARKTQNKSNHSIMTLVQLLVDTGSVEMGWGRSLSKISTSPTIPKNFQKNVLTEEAIIPFGTKTKST